MSESKRRSQRSHLKPKIVHIGFGAFHRAHQARYFDELFKLGLSDYGICGVNLFSGIDMIFHLKSHDYLYPILEQTDSSSELIIIKSVVKCLHPKIDGHLAIIEQIANPLTEIVSLTITEKGYCIDEAINRLDLRNESVLNDIQHLDSPKSAIGFIVAGLKLRYERSEKPITILSCDNLHHNGSKIKIAVTDFAKQIDSSFASWIESSICFPSTMVDRIVPAMTAESYREFEITTNQAHPCALMTESFRQWVIEDEFAQPRPKLEVVGVQFVNDVLPFEEMKLSMLNASHSFLAYLGFLAGFKTIDEVVADESFAQATLDLMIQFQIPTLKIKNEALLVDYANALIKRFSNPHLKHQTKQIAQDGSLKLPQRLISSIEWHLEHQSLPILPIVAIAGWMRYVAGLDEHNTPFDVIDPKYKEFQTIYNTHGLSKNSVYALLAFPSIFGTELPKNDIFTEKLIEIYNQLNEMGAYALIQLLVKKEYKL